MNDIWPTLAVFVAWFVLNTWLFPKLGVST